MDIANYMLQSFLSSVLDAKRRCFGVLYTALACVKLQATHLVAILVCRVQRVITRSRIPREGDREGR